MRKKFLEVRLVCKVFLQKQIRFLKIWLGRMYDKLKTKKNLSRSAGIRIEILTICVGGMSVFFYYYHIIFASNISKKSIVYIPKGTNFEEFIKIIQPMVDDVESFKTTCEIKRYTQNIHSGKYTLTAGMSNQEMINLLRCGRQTPVRLIFNHCHSLPKLAGNIARQLQADSISLLKTFRDSIFLKQHNFTSQTALSMYIPNTYDFFWDTDAESFSKRMFREYQNFWNSERQEKAKSKKPFSHRSCYFGGDRSERNQLRP